MRKAGDKTSADRIGNLREYDRYGAGNALDCSQGGTGRGKNHVWIQCRQFCRIGPQPAGVAATPTIFNFEVAAFDPSVLQQTQFESCNSGLPFHICFRREQNAEPPCVVRLLRTGGKRPGRCCCTNERDELAPPHWITSSARANKVGGIVRPSAFAALRLIMSSSFTARWTGRSPVFSPLRMRPA